MVGAQLYLDCRGMVGAQLYLDWRGMVGAHLYLALLEQLVWLSFPLLVF